MAVPCLGWAEDTGAMVAVYGVQVVRLLLAAVCGAVVGIQRERHEKAAGLRTHMLLAIGACLFSLTALRLHADVAQTDVMRLVQGMLMGTGFIAGGVIFRDGASVRGLTTATGLWVMGAVGLACGIGEYFLAIVATVLTVITLSVLRQVEQKLHHSGDKDIGDVKHP
ncbi:MAG: MgtC/SapB family protein [Planctomycetes bacterium]|nr:MgtC/SapB family protein [Planctomycetota bacterium]